MECVKSCTRKDTVFVSFYFLFFWVEAMVFYGNLLLQIEKEMSTVVLEVVVLEVYLFISVACGLHFPDYSLFC